MDQDPRIVSQSTHLAQARAGQPSANGANGAARTRLLRLVGLGILALTAVAGWYFVVRNTTSNGHAQQPDEKPPVPSVFNWDRPDLVIVISGQMHGHMGPCGCSDPQYGGLVRRHNFIQSLKDRGWNVLAADLGDIAVNKEQINPQRILKYEYSMKALRMMGYSAIGIGQNELTMPLTEALAHYSVQYAQPRPVTANLVGTDKDELFYDLNVRKFVVAKAGPFQVGVVGWVGSKTDEVVQKGLPAGAGMNFITDKDAVPKLFVKTFADMASQKADLGIMLYQGLESEAKKCAEFHHVARQKNPGLTPLQLVACLTVEEEPPGVPTRDAKFPGTSIITIGHKGRYVGVVGVWKTSKGPELKYQLVSMGPEWATPKGKENANIINVLMEQYAKEVADRNYLAKFQRTNHPNEFQIRNILKEAASTFYVGSLRDAKKDKCADCHPTEHKVWADSHHAHSYEALVNRAVNPKNRQFDGECVVCHVTGFAYKTGFNDGVPGAKNLKLASVSCESCHGPCSDHRNNPNDQRLYPIINPFGKTANPKLPEKLRQQKINDFCQKCHDVENDVHWGIGEGHTPFEQKWEKIAHPLPRNKQAAQGKGAGVKVQDDAPPVQVAPPVQIVPIQEVPIQIVPPSPRQVKD